MGIRSTIKSKLKESISSIKTFGKVIHDEAKYPGRPQPHMVARNPLWGGEDSPPAKDEHFDQAHQQIEHPIPEERKAPDGDEFWFLKDNDDGDDWTKTNPKE